MENKTIDYRLSTIDSIESYLKEHEHKDMLRFLTCGSVDDGKSTLIGRMLYDSKMVFDDQLSAVEAESEKYGTTGDKIDFALLVDGLQSEREQGITIDVAYRFFTTEKRKYIIADTPGHEQYTRNMVTGASTADVAIILIDARKGVLTQTKRHSYIVSLLGIRHIIVAINKMDLVKYSKKRFEEIKKEYKEEVLDKLPTIDHQPSTIDYIPLSALNGDNVVQKSEKMPWYEGKPILEHLDSVELTTNHSWLSTNFRFPVQYVNRPNLDFRGFCGTIASGSVKVGDEITVLPSGKTTKVKSIINAGDITEANRKDPLMTNDQRPTTNDYHAPMAITLTTEDEVDISRGDMIVHSNSLPRVSNELKVMLVWMDEEPMKLGKLYDIKRATTLLSGHIEHINYKVDVNTYKREQVEKLGLNDIASCKIVLTRPIAADHYIDNKQTGSFIIIDRITNNTVGAGMIVDVAKRESDKQIEEDIFNVWNVKKKEIDKNVSLPQFEEGEIVFLKMGKNIGYEQDGKGKEFLRPVYIYKKFNKEQFIGFAMTSKYHKQEKFYYQLDKDSYIILSQIRTYSAKRIFYAHKKVGKKTRQKIHEKFVKLVTPSR